MSSIWQMKVNYNHMKNKIIILMVLASVFTSCEHLEYSEASYYSDSDQIFDASSLAPNWLNNIYSYLPTDFNSIGGTMRSCASDDAENVWQSSAVQRLNNGAWGPSNPLDAQWSNNYKAIRAANFFMKEFDIAKFDDRKLLPGSTYEEEFERWQYHLAEARCLRAFFYFDLAKRYGGVPLVGDELLDREEANKLTKSTFDEVITYLVGECDLAAQNLPLSYEGVSNVPPTGKVTKGTALAIKARALLYAASPLHNPTGDNNKWIAAAAAAKEVMDLGIYSLADFSVVVNDRSAANTELIFERRTGNSNSFERANFPIGYEGGNTGLCPSQNLVDAFQTRNGYDVTLEASGNWVSDDPTFDAANPYDNRDPRFAATILYNGASFKGMDVESFIGGKNGSDLEGGTLTGYYLKKYIFEDIGFAPNSPVKNREHVWVLYRFAEIILNYAEAMNEAYGPNGLGGDFTMTASQAINMLRVTRGMPVITTSNVVEFREKLINERRVELAFEDHRYWDIRRWKIGEETKTVHGVKITKQSDGTLTYAPTVVDERLWEDKMYLYPFPYDETIINENLLQNTGW
ncbi:RagB/SusD family nutrient uptake outer membrane protein [Labilibacter sediminis]|nr:RagB/SusD family nutrient uptake outer membrane protein [Labilibacter sediminis]